MRGKLLFLCVVPLLLSACQATPATQSESAALIINRSEQGQHELQAAASMMLRIPTLTLADNTLTTSSEFVVARTPRYDASGQLVQGRVLETGHTLRLTTDKDKNCWLVYQEMRMLLKQVQCVSAKESVLK